MGMIIITNCEKEVVTVLYQYLPGGGTEGRLTMAQECLLLLHSVWFNGKILLLHWKYGNLVKWF